MSGRLTAALPVGVRRRLRSVRLVVWSLTDRLPRNGPAPGYGGLIGEGDFDLVGEEFLEHFRELGLLRPTDRVLDVGCGVGRMVAPLARYLTGGSYVGFDVVEAGIRSCRRRYRGLPGFRFDHVDVYNGKYNPKGTVRPDEFVFPYRDDEFDFAFATSVFTHMLSDDVERYLGELRRVLRPGRRCLATWFVMTPEALAGVEEGRSDVGFELRDGDIWLADRREPEAAVAFDLMTVREFYGRAGLGLVEPMQYGRWSGGEGLSYQDLVVASA